MKISWIWTLAAMLIYTAQASAAGWLSSESVDDTFTNLSAPTTNSSPWGDCCDDCVGNWWENTSIFFGSDAWRTRADDDYPGNFGFRTGFNSGFAGPWSGPIRMQLGASFAGYDLSGRDGDFGADPVHNASVEQQIFATFGFYKRSNVCNGERWAGGAVIDLLYDDHLGEEAREVFNRQARGYLGYAWDEANEFGTWFAFQLNWARYISDVRGRTRVRGLDQVNFFWHHNWDFGGDTWVYAGGTEQPGAWSLGLLGQAPLNSSIALYGGFSYVIPSAPSGDPFPGNNQFYSQEYWNVSFGIVWYPGSKAAKDTVSGQRGLPLLPLADNGSFMLKGPPGDL